MPERYLDAIVKFLSDREYQPLKIRQVARHMGVPEEHYAAFRDAVKRLKDEGRVVLGVKSTLSLPPMAETVVGVYRANPRGFGFVTPREANAHGDLFIPEGESGGAVTGDTVQAKVLHRGKREGRLIFHGRIVEIIERGQNRLVGQLHRAEGVWFVLPQGRVMTAPVVIDDVGPAGAEGVKVVVEIVRYADEQDLAHGVIIENLGAPGPADVETLGIIREYGLPDVFEADVLADARQAIEAFDPHGAGGDGRQDLSELTVVTIDPDDARDYDDAISLDRLKRGWRLGVHIADVAHFVRTGAPLDVEARQRGNSVYFPRKVLPMLPEILSNGVCSLQEGQVRFVKSVFIEYDEDAGVVGASFANAKIRSAKRLTYRQAQGILDGKVGGYESAVVRLVGDMNELARRIEARRRAAGMLHLDLPEVELVLSDDGKVVDAVPADASYTHTIIEMFMVEANEAVARLLDGRQVPFLRRIHPDSDVEGNKHLATFLRACGRKLPAKLTRFEMQSIIESVRGRPESYAVNLALLKTLESAEYSPMQVGHYALASGCYCHFTSPIRRYPDLTVHRLLDDHLRGRLEAGAGDISELTALGEHCSYTERRAARAEDDLRTILVLEVLTRHVGEVFEGVVTGITNFGLFVQFTRYLVEGLIKLENLGDDWWDVDAKHGWVTGQRSGRRIRMGDALSVRLMAVDLPQRRLDLLLERGAKPAKPAKKGGKKGKKPQAAPPADRVKKSGRRPRRR